MITKFYPVIRQTFDGWPTKMIFEFPHWKVLLSKGIKNMDDKDYFNI